MIVKICCAVFHKAISLGAGVMSDNFDMRGASRIKQMVESMEHDTATGEVIIMPIPATCGVGGKKRLKIRIPGGNVAMVIEADETPVAKPAPQGKQAA